MNKYIKISLVVITVALASLLVYYAFTTWNKKPTQEQEMAVYTCSMHPEISQNEPGNCPICGMNLVKKVTEAQPMESNDIDHLLRPTDWFVVGHFKTTMPIDTAISSAIKLLGIVAYDPNSSVNIAARAGGRIEKMYVNYKYQKVKKGQRLFDLYSPELLTEQQNFIYLTTHDSENIAILKASKQKLLLYGMTATQIKSLAAAKTTKPLITIFSPTNGIIQGTENKMEASPAGAMQKDAVTTSSLTLKEGDYIKKNEVVFTLMNTDKVWGVFNVMQGQSGLIKSNQPIRFSSELDENEFINAKVNFVETQLSETDKTNRIRVYLNNINLQFPIGLRLQGMVESNPIQGRWVHKKAVISIGSQKIVFIKMENGFKANEVKTGIEISDFIQVLSGLSKMEAIAENAQYLMDSESFIKTK